VKLLGWSAWHGQQHRCDNGVGQRVRVCLRGLRELESRAPIYKHGTFLLVREPKSIKNLHRIHG
jgi:hypothetical protein